MKSSFAVFAESPKLRKDDRIINLKPIKGSTVKSSTGMEDPRLFTGENKLHAIRGKDNLWTLKYEFGVLAQPLKQRFTSFDTLLKFVKNYYKTRGIEVTDVID